MEAKVFKIPHANQMAVIERMTKLERTAARLGLPFPTVTYGEPYSTTHRDAMTGREYRRWWLDVALEGEGIDRPVSYGDWKIIGQFNHQYPKVILNKLSDKINPYFIQRFEAENRSWCQHCNKAVARHNTYVIEKDGSQMLVGSSCMKHFVPLEKPLDSVMSYYLGVAEAFVFTDEENRRYSESFVDTEYYLAAVFQLLMVVGSVKSEYFGAAFEYVKSHTLPKERGTELYDIVKAAHSYYFDALSERQHMMQFIAQLPGNNEFNVRLMRMCDGGVHLPKDNNTVIWGAVKYYDYLFKAEERVAAKETHWIAQVGEVIDLPVKFGKRVFLYSSEYGDSYLYSFITNDGDVITWKTSYIDQEIDNIVSIKGRVKELTEFNGVKQTQITRARMTF